MDWGWVYKRPELNYYTTFFENINEEDYLINPDAFNDPMPLIYEAGGNYDAIGGVISNFEYKLREDGGFDCVTNLTSIGVSIFKSYQVDRASNEFGISINDDGTTSQIQTDSIVNAVLNLDSILDSQLDAPMVVKAPTSEDLTKTAPTDPAGYDAVNRPGLGPT